MAKSGKSTPKKAKEQQLCEDVEAEFCLRALSLFASFYETCSIEEIATFPPPKTQTVPQPEKSIDFNSPIIDHRLRRNQEKRAASIANEDKILSLRAEDISNQMDKGTNLVNLDEIFAPEKANRSETPKYILNQEMDRQIEREKHETHHRPLDMKTIQKQFRTRLAASKKRGEERCRMRIERQEESAKQTTKQTQKMFQSKKPVDQQPSPETQKLIARGNLKKRLNYSPNVKITPKKVDPKYANQEKYL